jgi:zinc protease
MDALRESSFPSDEVKREVAKKLASIQAQEDRPGEVASKAFDKRLFGEGPYGHPAIGTKESVQSLTQEDVVRFFRDYYHPNNSILAFVGDIDAGSVKRFKDLLEAWPRGVIPETKGAKSAEAEEGIVKIDRPVTQSNIIIGHRGISRENPDYYALSVMNYILGGGGFSSRLTEEIRNRRGLAYSVDSFFDAAKLPGPFEIVLQTKNVSSREAIALALKEMGTMQEGPVSEKELEGAKKYLVGSFPLRLNTQAKIASFLTLIEYFGLGLDYPDRYPSLINAVSEKDVRRVARQYLHPDKYILVIVADLKQAGME